MSCAVKISRDREYTGLVLPPSRIETPAKGITAQPGRSRPVIVLMVSGCMERQHICRHVAVYSGLGFNDTHKP